MKKTARVKTIIYALVTLSILGLIFVPLQQKQKAAQTVNTDFITRVSQGLAEAQISNLRVSPTVGVNSITNLMEIRSGIRFSSSVRTQLARQEIATINGVQPLISYDKLVDNLTDTALEQASQLTNTDITQIVTVARGFTAPNMPESLKNQDIAIFPGYYVDTSNEVFTTQLKAITSPQAQLLVRRSIRSKIEEEVRMHLIDYAAAAPETFGENWDSANNKPGKGLTPSKAILLTYSLVSGDSFADTTNGLNTKMQKLQEVLTTKYGSYPSPLGHTPYGINGYLFSSAISIFFNEKNQMVLLNKFAGNQ